MSQNHLKLNVPEVIILLLFAVLFASCSVRTEAVIEPENNPALPLISKDQTLTKADFCSELYHAHIDAWNSRDVENLKVIYTEDIVHFDGEPLFVGIDEVSGMAEDMWQFFPEWEMKVGSTYISKEACLGEWINWNVFSFSEEDPGIEFDLLNYQDDKVHYWRAFYDKKFLDIFSHGDYIDENLLKNFASAWSSDDPTKIVEIYSDDALIIDTLFDISLDGNTAISEYADAYIRQFPGVKWDLVYSFAEDYSEYSSNTENPFHPQGGVFSITLQILDNDPCEIKAVVLLTPDNENKITEQSIYYDADSIVRCGLAK
ncbi:MAG TPA: nuclear transport factor 2 family protein [Brevefilum sp.]